MIGVGSCGCFEPDAALGDLVVISGSARLGNTNTIVVDEGYQP